MGEAELVLQNRLAIDQRLDFIGEGVEGLGQSLGKECVGHPISRGGGDVGEGSHWSGVGASMTAELGKLGLWGVWGWCVARRKKGGKGSIGQLFFLRLGQVQARPHPLLRAECLAGSGARGASGADRGALFHHLHSVSRTRWRTAGRCRYSMARGDDVFVSLCLG